MQGWSRSRSILTACLLVASAGLGSTVYDKLVAPPISLVAVLPASAAAAETKTAVTAFAMPSLDTYAEVTARPLFMPTRRPAPLQAASADRVDAQALVLVGVILAENGSAALIGRANLPGARRVTVGEEVEGWTLAEIHPDRVLLRSGNTQAELRLKDRKPGQSPPRPVATPVLPRP